MYSNLHEQFPKISNFYKEEKFTFLKKCNLSLSLRNRISKRQLWRLVFYCWSKKFKLLQSNCVWEFMDFSFYARFFISKAIRCTRKLQKVQDFFLKTCRILKKKLYSFLSNLTGLNLLFKLFQRNITKPLVRKTKIDLFTMKIN